MQNNFKIYIYRPSSKRFVGPVGPLTFVAGMDPCPEADILFDRWETLWNWVNSTNNFVDYPVACMYSTLLLQPQPWLQYNTNNYKFTTEVSKKPEVYIGPTWKPGNKKE